MPTRLSKAAIDRLGVRLAAPTIPVDEDLRQLAAAQAQWLPALEHVHQAVSAAVASSTWASILHITARRKTASTLIDKLRRGMQLSTIQDVVGIRVVGFPTCHAQDAFVRDLQQRFQAKIVDRRLKPMHGYRAVHVIAKFDGYPVEIQVRTLFQHIWANTTESIADGWGRGVRYGEPPSGDDPHVVAERTIALQHWLKASQTIAEIEDVLDQPSDPAIDRAASVKRLSNAFRALLDAGREASPHVAQALDAAFQDAKVRLESAQDP